MQNDHLLPYLTVYETLLFAARLRLPSTMTYQEKINRVNEVIIELGLKECRHTLIGNSTCKGISGGEKRRVTIGIQMLTDVNVLLLDEPSKDFYIMNIMRTMYDSYVTICFFFFCIASGLDSFTAQHITHTLKRIAQHGRTVVCSMHQVTKKIKNK
jgi:ABC-type multidrug transport system ATPase subunit